MCANDQILGKGRGWAGATSMKGILINQFKLSFWAIKRDEAKFEPLTFCHISLFQKCCRVWNTLLPFTGWFLRKHLTWQKSWHWYLFLPSNLPLKTQSVTETAESLPPELFLRQKQAMWKLSKSCHTGKVQISVLSWLTLQNEQHLITRGMRKLGY